jgi:hypothetical protein
MLENKKDDETQNNNKEESENKSEGGFINHEKSIAQNKNTPFGVFLFY